MYIYVMPICLCIFRNNISNMHYAFVYLFSFITLNITAYLICSILRIVEFQSLCTLILTNVAIIIAITSSVALILCLYLPSVIVVTNQFSISANVYMCMTVVYPTCKAQVGDGVSISFSIQRVTNFL